MEMSTTLGAPAANAEWKARRREGEHAEVTWPEPPLPSYVAVPSIRGDDEGRTHGLWTAALIPASREEIMRA
jgi:hypothetical protein